MKKRHARRSTSRHRVAEPVQVYLDPPDRERLERLAAKLETTKSDVLRQGLVALEAQTGRAAPDRASAAPLPTFSGHGLKHGVDLDDSGGLRDLMDGRDAVD